MNIFEEFDALINKASAVNESKEKIKYSDIPYADGMETYEEGEEYVREYFRKELLSPDGPMPPPPPKPPEPKPVSPPPPPFRKKKMFKPPVSDPSKDWEEEELIWDEDDFLKKLEIEADELEREREMSDKEFEEYDDFMDATEPKGGEDDDDLADDIKKKDEFSKTFGDDEIEDDVEHKKYEDDEDDDDEDDKKRGGGSSGKGEGKSDDKDKSSGGGGGDEDEDEEEDEFGKDDKSSGGGKGKSKKDKGDDTEGDGGDGEGEDGEGGDTGDDGEDTTGMGGSSGKDGSRDRKRKDMKGGSGGGGDDEGDEGDEGDDEDGKGGGGGKSGKEDEEKEGEGGSGGGGDDESKEGDDEDEKGGSGGGEGDDDKSEDGEDDKGGSSGGKKGEKADSTGESGISRSEEELREAIEDALERMKEHGEMERDELEELTDMLDDDSVTEEDLDRMSEKIDEEREGKRERFSKASELVGRIEETPSMEDLKKEIEASKLSEEEIEEMKEATLPAAETDTLPTDEEVDRLKKKAMKELDKRCKGKSRLASSILYHSLKTPKLDKSDWDVIMEKILAKKSKHLGSEKSKTKKIRLGDKNHIWRDVRYTYKTVKEGIDTQSIYCFIDYSGSVKSKPGLIITFLGKVLELCGKLEYTDLTCYTFADYLSVPRVINKDMIKKEEYETVLAETIEFFNLPENGVGGFIENFSLVGEEISRIKRKDKDSVMFIFGDGIWTFYGNSDPPQRLLETCPKWIDDIIPFVFIPEDEADDEWYNEYIGKEVSVLKDVVGIKDVILTKASKMRES